MTSLCNNNKRSPRLKAGVIEPILSVCMKGVSIYELSFEIQRLFPLPYITLKKYLFYLISYELVSYIGKNGIFVTEDWGLDLLYKINQERQKYLANDEDITITIE
jgi:hypothetical protein